MKISHLAPWFVFMALLSACFGSQEEMLTPEAAPVTVTAPPVPEYDTYTVQRGEFLDMIADRLGVPRMSLRLANRDMLMDNAGERCGKLSERYRTRTTRGGRQGYYCNERIELQGAAIAWANSLQPGDVLRVPKDNAPIEVSEAVATMPAGAKVVLVIDETGSMSDDRQAVATWYLSALQSSGRTIEKVVLFHEGEVRELNASGELTLNTDGDYENVREALEVASTHNPDAIVLVTDEPGDDWGDWNLGAMPPVYAHSLNDPADYNMQRVAKVTGGKFIRGLHSQVAGN